MKALGYGRVGGIRQGDRTSALARHFVLPVPSTCFVFKLNSDIRSPKQLALVKREYHQV